MPRVVNRNDFHNYYYGDIIDIIIFVIMTSSNFVELLHWSIISILHYTTIKLFDDFNS